MKNLIENTNDLFAVALATMKRKNSDYSGDDSGTLRNFELGAEIVGTTVPQAILTRLMDKIVRTGNLLRGNDPSVKQESIFDTIQDGINYFAILYYALLLEQEKQK